MLVALPRGIRTTKKGGRDLLHLEKKSAYSAVHKPDSTEKEGRGKGCLIV